MADFTWQGGTSGLWSTPANWSPSGPPTYGTISVATGTIITLPSGGAGTINGLVVTGTSGGTVTLSGGSISFSNGLAPAAGFNVTLLNTTFTTTSYFGGGGGTITLDGAKVTASGSAAAGTLIFDTVLSGGTPNVLNITDQSQGLTLQGLGYGDSISVGGNNVLSLTLNSNGTTYTLTDNHGGYTTTVSSNVTLAAGTNAADFTSSSGTFSYTGSYTVEAHCFYPGTMLAKDDGEIAVESVTTGMLLKTASGELLPVRWVGWSQVAMRFADPLRILPIRIKAGALADGVPARDLLVSPDHAVFVEDVLVQAAALVNGTSITREEDVPESFRYYHIELATHELLLAEGCPAESFVDNIDCMNFHNWDAREAPAEPVVEMDYPRARSSRQVPVSIRSAIAARATRLVAACAA